MFIFKLLYKCPLKKGKPISFAERASKVIMYLGVFAHPKSFLLSPHYCILVSLSGTMSPGLSVHTVCARLHTHTHTRTHTPLRRSHAPQVWPMNIFHHDDRWVTESRAQNNLNLILTLDFSVIEVNIFSFIFKSVCIEFSVTFNQQ